MAAMMRGKLIDAAMFEVWVGEMCGKEDEVSRFMVHGCMTSNLPRILGCFRWGCSSMMDVRAQ